MAVKPRATEQLDFGTALTRLARDEAHLDKLLTRLGRIRPIPRNARFLDIGAAHGSLLIACAKRGLRAEGIEPWEPARQVAEQLAAHEGVSIKIMRGMAEELPQPSCSFDIVHANAVLEHVHDAQAMLEEAFRVLRPNGILWFSAASSMCPWQHEIKGFPLFGWYPNPLKRHIMKWAKANRPELIGHTDMPAMNWLTRGKARRMLRRAGFGSVYDRWDLRLPEEGGKLHQHLMHVIQSFWPARAVADTLVSCCSFAAVKDGRVPVTTPYPGSSLSTLFAFA